MQGKTTDAARFSKGKRRETAGTVSAREIQQQRRAPVECQRKLRRICLVQRAAPPERQAELVERIFQAGRRDRHFRVKAEDRDLRADRTAERCGLQDGQERAEIGLHADIGPCGGEERQQGHVAEQMVFAAAPRPEDHDRLPGARHARAKRLRKVVRLLLGFVDKASPDTNNSILLIKINLHYTHFSCNRKQITNIMNYLHKQMTFGKKMHLKIFSRKALLLYRAKHCATTQPFFAQGIVFSRARHCATTRL